MDSDSSFEDVEGDYLRLCEERRSNLVSRDTEDHLPIVPQPIPPPVVPTVVPPLVSVSNTISERTDTSSGSSMSYASINKEDNQPASTSTETQMETETSTPAVVVVTIKQTIQFQLLQYQLIFLLYHHLQLSLHIRSHLLIYL